MLQEDSKHQPGGEGLVQRRLSVISSGGGAQWGAATELESGGMIAGDYSAGSLSW